MGQVTGRELARKIVHMGVGLIAFSVVFLGPLYSALLALAAVLMNVFVLPRAGGKLLWRQAETERDFSLGIVLYPAAVLALILVFWNHLEIAAAVWGILAFGDGMASLVGMTVGGPKLPWNARKTWSGTLAYTVFGTIGAATLLWWTLDRGGEPYWLPYLIVAAFVTAVFSALIESQPIELDDNVSVPLLAGLMLLGMMQAQDFWRTEIELDRLGSLGVAFLAGVGINLILGGLAYAKRSVDESGLVGGVLIGAVIWTFLDWRGWLVLVAFFVLGTGATKLGYKRKAERGLAQEGGGRRSARHAFANSGVPMVAAVFAGTTGLPELYLPAFVAAFATAAGDTASSEIGQLYGRRTFLITTLRPVPRGTEGAVSVEGTVAGILGSLLVASLGWFFDFYCWGVMLLVTLAAFIGTTLESLIGATIEKWGLLDNESVNFLNTLIGALAAAGLVALFAL
ncbi:MAG: TIGR00297 family protein [Acidobacteriota bacterium]